MSFFIYNWRDATSYPDSNKTRAIQWAWEFLRRNPEYRADFEKWKDRQYPPADIDDEVDDYILGNYEICDPPALPGETKKQYVIRNREGGWCIKPAGAALAEKWRLSFPFLADPKKNKPTIGFLTASGPPMVDMLVHLRISSYTQILLWSPSSGLQNW